MTDQYRGIGAATPGASRDDADSLIGSSTTNIGPSSGANLYPNPSAPPPGSDDDRLQQEEVWRRELDSVSQCFTSVLYKVQCT